MRSKAQLKTRIRHILAASAFSFAFATPAFLIVMAFFNADMGRGILFGVAVFVFVFALTAVLWKKTDLVHSGLYIAHCIANPLGKRKYYCPCCNRSIARFADMGYYDDTERFDPGRFKKCRQDVICPFCYSAPRQRILATYACENMDLFKRSKILYFAPEYSMMKWMKRNGIKPVTADLADPHADLKIDLTDTELGDGSYDMIICNHVLEHVSDHTKALSEMHRILSPGGVLIISFPIDQDLDTVFEKDTSSASERIRLFGQYDHLRIFGKDSREMMERYGFSVTVIDAEKMQGSILPVTGPGDYDSNIIFCCTKDR